MADTVVQYVLKMDDQTSEALKKTGDEADKTAKKTASVSKETRIAGVSMKALAASAVAAAAAVVALGQKLADVRNLLTDMSVRTGIAVDTLAGLRLAADGSGLAFESLARNLTKIPQLIADVERGAKKQVDAFKAIGLSVEDIAGSNPDKVFRDIMIGLGNIEDPGRRAIAATDLLGASGTRMLQALGDPKQLENFIAFTKEFGLDVGPQAAKTAGDFERSMADLGLVLEAQVGRIFKVFGGEGIGGIIDDFTAGIQFMADVAIPLVEGRIKLLVGAFTGLKILVTEGADAWVQHNLKLAESAKGLLDLPEIFENAADRMMRFRQGQTLLRSAVDATAEGLAGLGKQAGKTVKDLEEIEPALTAAAEALVSFVEEFGALESMGQGVESMRESIGHLFSDMGDGLSELERLQIAQIDLGLAFRQNAIDADEYAHAMAGVQSSIEELTNFDAAEFSASMTAAVNDALAVSLSGGVAGLSLDIGGSLAGGDVGGALTKGLTAFLGPLGAVIGDAVSTIASIGARGADSIVEGIVVFMEDFFAGLREIPKIQAELPARLAKALPGILRELIESSLSPAMSEAILEGAIFMITKLPGEMLSAIINGVWTALQLLWDTFTSWWASGKEFITKGEDDRGFLKNLGDFFVAGSDGAGLLSNLGIDMAFDKGGRVSRTGLALVHRKERIVQPGAAPGGSTLRAMGGNGASVVVNINAAVVDGRAVQRFVRELERIFGDYGGASSPLLGG